MTAEAIALLLRDGGPSALAALFAWLYLSERSKVNALQDARLADAQKLTAEQAATGEAMRNTMAENTRSMDANTKIVEAAFRQMGRNP